MTARQKAVSDIKESLKAQGKCFLAFKKELNPIMDSLVEEQLKAQEIAFKFKQGDNITAIEPGKGFEKAIVSNIFTATKGKYKGKRMYRLRIPNGTATVPITAECCYKLSNKSWL